MTRPDKELEYYAKIFEKIRNKKYEFYVISRIVHLLNDRELEFTTQQLVRTEEGRFLLDLYFPQLNLAIEVDESYHANDRQIDKDKERDKAVLEAANVCTERIEISEISEISGQSKSKSIDDVNSRISDVIRVIKEKKKELKLASQFVPFVYGQKYKTEHWLKIGRLSVSDDARFHTHVDVAKLFGKNYEGHQKATIKLDDDNFIWFPKLYQNKDWNNELSPDGLKIQMRNVPSGKYDSNKRRSGDKCYVFAHHHDEFGEIYYAFKGVFVTEQRGNEATFSRVFDAIEFDEKGGVKPINRAGALNKNKKSKRGLE
jgi:very-short-patch-repair endonuclease